MRQEAGLRKIKAQVEKMGLVEAVAAPDAEMVDTMSTNIEKAAYVLGVNRTGAARHPFGC